MGEDGSQPSCNLIIGSDGNFYGTTYAGGSTVYDDNAGSGYGTVFKMTPTGTFTVLHSFRDGSVTNDGAGPYAGLTIGTDGNFYGTTTYGGSANKGTVFKMTPAGVVTILHSFQDGSITNDGAIPNAGLIIGSDGNLYGTTTYGGPPVGGDALGLGYGTFFKITPAGVMTLLHSFTGMPNDGACPYAALILGPDGNFYGTTQGGGSTFYYDPTNFGFGTIFKVTPAGVVSILWSFFNGSSSQDGFSPMAALTLRPDGNFYGTTAGSRSVGNGIVFKIGPTGLTTLHTFMGGANDGANPQASLITGPDGNLYGTTLAGGSGGGTVFQMTPAGNVTILHAFSDGSVANDGFEPVGGLTLGSDGNFYGTAIYGPNNSGIIFRISPVNLLISAPTQASAGAPVTVTITAVGQTGSINTGYTGTVHFTSTDPKAILPANATITNGTGTFTVKFRTAGSRTVTATDTVSTAINCTTAPIAVTSASAGHFKVSAPTAATAGTPFSFTVTALDQFGNTDAAYNGIVHFTSSDAFATLPADTTLVNGVATRSATIQAAGNQVITATDTDSEGITGTSNLITVAPASTSHLLIDGPADVPNGTPFGVIVAAQDQYGNPAYMGEVHFTSSDPKATLPPNFTVFFGVGPFVTLKTAGPQTVTVTDVNNPANNATLSVNVAAGPPTHITMTAPATTISGAPFNFTVTARDADENVATGYTGILHFTSTDLAAHLPADTHITNGTGSLSATFYTGATQTLRAQDTANASFSATATIAVTANHFTITAPSTANAQAVFNAVVTAKDQLNNTVSGYTGTIHLTSTDPSAVLPADFTLTAGTKQVIIKLRTSGLQTITATDTASPTVTGTSSSINVNPVVYKLILSGPTTATAGIVNTYIVNAADSVNNTVTSYSGTVHVTSSDPNAVLPGDVTLTNGTASFTVTFKTATTVFVTATDTVNSSIKGSFAGIVVSGGAASQFVVTAPASTTSGAAFYATVTAKDAYGNLAKSYTGTVHFTSTDPLAVLPANTTLANGTKQVSVKLKTHGNQTVTATDIANTGITETSSMIAVN